MKRPYKVLIAQQGTITPYRIPLYNAIEQRRPPDWTFTVVYDSDRSQKHDYYRGLSNDSYNFPTLPAVSRTWKLAGRRLMWQSFFTASWHYDVIVTDTYVKHLTYLALFLNKLARKKRVWWGIPNDLQAIHLTFSKHMAENFKRQLLRFTDHFLAYTPGSRQYLVDIGYPPDNITVLNNTIDIEVERQRFLKFQPQRDAIRREMGIATHRKVILYVGRLTRLKRVPMLLDLIRELHKLDPAYMLLIIGAGEDEPLVRGAAADLGSDILKYLGTVDDPDDTARVYVASDLYYVPSYVGLGPLQAFSYDLPVIATELEWHSPEVEYLNPSNSVFLPDKLAVPELAMHFHQAGERLMEPGFRSHIYETISRFTITAMADQYIAGINKVLKLDRQN